MHLFACAYLLVLLGVWLVCRFHEAWQETIYGADRHGHPLVMMDVRTIDIAAISAIPDALLNRLVGQKMAAYRAYTEFLSAQYGVQRYKISYLIDMEGSGMSAFVGETKATMQKIFKIGSEYFPETLWKMYLMNTPFAVRMGWSVISVGLWTVWVNFEFIWAGTEYKLLLRAWSLIKRCLLLLTTVFLSR